MWRVVHTGCCAALFGLVCCLGDSRAQEPLALGSRLELMVDEYLIAEREGLERHLHKPQAREVVIVCDEPWEGNISAYYTLLADGPLYRMYYRGAHFDEVSKKPTHPEFTCYAESRDGVHWIKPKLGLVEFAGSKENNIILAGEATHNFTPMLDTNPACKAEARYKALAGGSKGLKAYQSSDAIHWQPMRDQPVITDGDFDSQNLAIWYPSQQRYLAYHRKLRDRVRDIMVSSSTDFVHWDQPRYLEYGEAPPEHLYTNAIAPYFRAPHLLVGFPTRFQPKTQQVEPIVMFSRDGLNFQRSSDELISISDPEDRDGNRSNYMTNGVLMLPVDGREISLFATEAYYAGPGSRVRRFTLRVDGFGSLRAGDQVGQLVSRPLTFAGKDLHLNYVVQAGGRVRVELQDVAGEPLEGFRLEQCQPLVGDGVDEVVRWSGGSVNGLAGQPLRVRIELRSADLYALQFK